MAWHGHWLHAVDTRPGCLGFVGCCVFSAVIGWHQLASVGIEGALDGVSPQAAMVPPGRLNGAATVGVAGVWPKLHPHAWPPVGLLPGRPSLATGPAVTRQLHRHCLSSVCVCVCRRLQSCLGHMTCCLLQHLPALGHWAPFEPQPYVAVPCPLLPKPWTDSKARAPPSGATWCGVDMLWSAPLT